jgi:hypothetical protein
MTHIFFGFHAFVPFHNNYSTGTVPRGRAWMKANNHLRTSWPSGSSFFFPPFSGKTDQKPDQLSTKRLVPVFLHVWETTRIFQTMNCHIKLLWKGFMTPGMGYASLADVSWRKGEIFDVRDTSHGGKLFLKYYTPIMSMTGRSLNNMCSILGQWRMICQLFRVKLGAP